MTTYSEETPATTGLEIAIIGMAGRFPGARDVETFWQNLRQGICGIRFFSDDEMLQANPDLDRALVSDPRYVKANGVLDGVEDFDAGFFGYNPREAEVMDPQQRLFLECAWEALENAGYDPSRASGLIGVYGGVSMSSYVLNLLSQPELMRSLSGLQLTIGNDKDYLATRVSYKLNLEGPSVNVQSACSTSLLSVHLACQGLLSGEADMALAGGVSVALPQTTGYLYNEAGITSPDGLCRAFDANGKGTVGGNGLGLVVLKRLADAIADGDNIRAVIKGSAVNNDGSMKVGFTAPRVEGQRQVIRTAQQLAEVEPETITYIESHGTATELGDPIEITALTEVFRRRTDKQGFCAVGAVKTNIGHLDAAAGIAGLIKTTLVVERGEIPPNLHFESPNPELDLDNSPFYIPTELRSWDTDGAPRRAGVSAFGLGGTNVHVVLEEAPVVDEVTPSRRHQLLLLSARSQPALDAQTVALGERLEACDLPLPDVAYTTQVGRKAFSHRRVLVCRELSSAARALQEKDAGHLHSAVYQDTGDRALAFLFSGLGDQYPSMASGLYRDELVFRDQLDRCVELFEPHVGIDLRQVIFPSEATVDRGSESEDGPAAAAPRLDLRKMVRPRAASPGAEEDDDPATRRLNETRYTQPALFAVELALARLWMSWGLRPQAMAGYSLGEYVAATVAGVMTLEEATRLVAERAKLIHQLDAGAMLAVPLPEAELAGYLGDELDLSAVNGPSFCVAAGHLAAIEALADRLEGEGVACRRLQTSHAFHSRAMRPIVEPLRRLLATLELKPPRIPYLSNVTGGWIRDEEATDPEYWLRHLCQPVRFGDALTELWREPGRVLLEVGPGQSLISLALQFPAAEEGASQVALPSLRSRYEHGQDQARLLTTLGQLWLAGLEVSWPDFYGEEKRRRVALPTYPFERQRFWIDRGQGGLGPMVAAEPSREKLPDLADWFYVPSWQRLSAALREGELAAGPWWVLHDNQPLAETLMARLAEAGHEVVPVLPGDAYDSAEGRPTIDPALGEHYDRLLEELGPPAGVLHLWTLTKTGQGRQDDELAAALEARGFYSLMALGQALDRSGLDAPVPILVLTNSLFTVERGDTILPEKSTLLGPVRVIPQELAKVRCRLIEVGEEASESAMETLWHELRRQAAEPVVACRGPHRWVPTSEPLPLHTDDCGADRLRRGGVYLITGGLGGIGLGMADYLAREWQARLVLLGRSALPERSQWHRHRQANGGLGRKIRQVEALEAAGSEVLVLAADVSDLQEMRGAVDQARERFGELHGVIHAAGVPGAGLIQLKTREMAAAVLASKVAGTRVLEEVLGDLAQPLDFVALFSSLSSVLGGIGQVDYCAANAYLGAFAQWSGGRRSAGRRSAGRGETPVVTIDWCEWQWDAWSGEGLAVFNDEVRDQMSSQRQISGLSFEEGAEVMRRALASGLSQVLVSTRPLDARIENENTISEVLAQLEELSEPGSRHPRPELTTEFVAPRDAAETTIAGIWQDLLGVDRIGVHDDFFQLGGHSLLGTQLVSRLKEHFGVSVPLRILFEAPTIAGLAEVVAETTPDSAASSLPAITRVERNAPAAGQVDDMSDDEVDAMLAELLAQEQEQV